MQIVHIYEGKEVKTLREMIRDKLCNFNDEKIKCHCKDIEGVVTNYCAYGTCVIYKCLRCGGVVKYYLDICRFPYRYP